MTNETFKVDEVGNKLKRTWKNASNQSKFTSDRVSNNDETTFSRRYFKKNEKETHAYRKRRKCIKSNPVAVTSLPCNHPKIDSCRNFRIVLFDIAGKPEWKKHVVAYKAAELTKKLGLSRPSTFSTCDVKSQVKSNSKIVKITEKEEKFREFCVASRNANIKEAECSYNSNKSVCQISTTMNVIEDLQHASVKASKCIATSKKDTACKSADHVYGLSKSIYPIENQMVEPSSVNATEPYQNSNKEACRSDVILRDITCKLTECEYTLNKSICQNEKEVVESGPTAAYAIKDHQYANKDASNCNVVFGDIASKMTECSFDLNDSVCGTEEQIVKSSSSTGNIIEDHQYTNTNVGTINTPFKDVECICKIEEEIIVESTHSSAVMKTIKDYQYADKESSKCIAISEGTISKLNETRSTLDKFICNIESQITQSSSTTIEEAVEASNIPVSSSNEYPKVLKNGEVVKNDVAAIINDSINELSPKQKPRTAKESPSRNTAIPHPPTESSLSKINATSKCMLNASNFRTTSKINVVNKCISNTTDPEEGYKISTASKQISSTIENKDNIKCSTASECILDSINSPLSSMENTIQENDEGNKPTRSAFSNLAYDPRLPFESNIRTSNDQVIREETNTIMKTTISEVGKENAVNINNVIVENAKAAGNEDLNTIHAIKIQKNAFNVEDIEVIDVGISDLFEFENTDRNSNSNPPVCAETSILEENNCAKPNNCFIRHKFFNISSSKIRIERSEKESSNNLNNLVKGTGESQSIKNISIQNDNIILNNESMNDVLDIKVAEASPTAVDMKINKSADKLELMDNGVSSIRITKVLSTSNNLIGMNNRSKSRPEPTNDGVSHIKITKIVSTNDSLINSTSNNTNFSFRTSHRVESECEKPASSMLNKQLSTGCTITSNSVDCRIGHNQELKNRKVDKTPRGCQKNLNKTYFMYHKFNGTKKCRYKSGSDVMINNKHKCRTFVESKMSTPPNIEDIVFQIIQDLDPQSLETSTNTNERKLKCGRKLLKQNLHAESAVSEQESIIKNYNKQEFVINSLQESSDRLKCAGKNGPNTSSDHKSYACHKLKVLSTSTARNNDKNVPDISINYTCMSEDSQRFVRTSKTNGKLSDRNGPSVSQEGTLDIISTLKKIEDPWYGWNNTSYYADSELDHGLKSTAERTCKQVPNQTQEHTDHIYSAKYHSIKNNETNLKEAISSTLSPFRFEQSVYRLNSEITGSNNNDAKENDDRYTFKDDEQEKSLSKIPGETNPVLMDTEPVICWKCGISSKCERMFGMHFTSLHLDSSVLQCLYCPKEFEYEKKDAFEQHYVKHLREKEENARKKALQDVWGSKNDDLGAYIVKFFSKDGDILFCCLKCNNRTTSYRDIETHMQEIHHVARKQITISCTLCGIYFSSGVAKRYHYLTKHRDKMNSCKYCYWLYMTKPSYYVHLKTCPLRRFQEDSELPESQKQIEVDQWWIQNDVNSENWVFEHNDELSRQRQKVAKQRLFFDS